MARHCTTEGLQEATHLVSSLLNSVFSQMGRRDEICVTAPVSQASEFGAVRLSGASGINSANDECLTEMAMQAMLVRLGYVDAARLVVEMRDAGLPFAEGPSVCVLPVHGNQSLAGQRGLAIERPPREGSVADQVPVFGDLHGLGMNTKAPLPTPRFSLGVEESTDDFLETNVGTGGYGRTQHYQNADCFAAGTNPVNVEESRFRVGSSLAPPAFIDRWWRSLLACFPRVTPRSLMLRHPQMILAGTPSVLRSPLT